jgi:hypothetical protein
MGAVVMEHASGVIDGVNTTFSTSMDYVAGSVTVFLNGLANRELKATEGPFRSFQLTQAPRVGDVLAVYYQAV